MKKPREFRISRTHVASNMARGPGSYFGKSKALQAAAVGNWELAVKLAKAHNRELRHTDPHAVSAETFAEWDRDAKMEQIRQRVERG